MDGTFSRRTLVETDLFAAQLQALGDCQRLDEALTGLSWALGLCPQDYPIVPGTKRLRLAKTPYVEWAGGRVGALYVWFTIKDDEKVYLLAIERIEDIDDDLWSDTDTLVANP